MDKENCTKFLQCTTFLILSISLLIWTLIIKNIIFVLVSIIPIGICIYGYWMIADTAYYQGEIDAYDRVKEILLITKKNSSTDNMAGLN